MQKILSALRRAIQDYDMIQDGDRIFVGVSGGKDSILLLAALKAYQRFSPEKFTLEAITVDMGLKDVKQEELDALDEYCKSIGVERHIVKTDIAEIVFEAREEQNPCSLCAKMRRGALNNEINRLGGGKLALGHNADDVAETMLLSLLYEGRFSCFAPKAYMDKSKVTLIRPMIYIEEYDVKSAVERLNLPVVQNPCPMNHFSKREYAKDLIKHICETIPFAKERILGAIYHPERNNLWEKPRD
ncbi:MAG: tRNA 2-thiocytidine biosynthesis TtcA family protein [Clostridia bacterium]|nr:tRNA 2-thiocytidine biosynthesis TtcA family protein [Clostridia bacterium]